jgi:hypothetical protein
MIHFPFIKNNYNDEQYPKKTIKKKHKKKSLRINKCCHALT